MFSKLRGFTPTFIATLIVSATAFAQEPANHEEHMLYSASDSTEAIMTFKHQVEFTTSHAVTVSLAREQIDKQLTHLFGPMSVARYKAVPKGNEAITQVRIFKSKKPGGHTYVATYSYQGTIVVQNGAGSTYEVLLPVNPDTIYKAGTVTSSSGAKSYPCTDSHYQTEGDFWYFWNPAQRGCKLRPGVDYNKVTTQIQRIQNSVQTYPEYSRLADQSGTIRISVLMGMNDPSEGMDPTTSNDINASNYLGIRKNLIEQMGYTDRVLSQEEIKKLSGDADTLPYVEELSKNTEKAKIVVTLFFGPTGIEEKSKAFHYFLKAALEKNSIMIYDGHSGLGGHLDLKSIEDTENFTIQPNQDQYQIYYFNSCSSYTYYNSLYFGRKVSSQDPKGTKNLDIITNGLSTYFSTMGETDMVTIQSVDAWASNQGSISFQKIIQNLDSDNLSGVNGDEDNPTSP